MKKTNALFMAAIFIMFFSSALAAKEKPGADIIVVKADAGRLRGELIAVKKDSLLLLANGAPKEVAHFIAWAEMTEVIIVGKSKCGQGPAAGAPVGGASGFIRPYAGGDESPNFMRFSTSDRVAQGAVAYGLIELVVEGIGKASSGADISIPVDATSEAKLRIVRAKLAERARVRGIQ